MKKTTTTHHASPLILNTGNEGSFIPVEIENAHEQLEQSLLF